MHEVLVFTSTFCIYFIHGGSSLLITRTFADKPIFFQNRENAGSLEDVVVVVGLFSDRLPD